MRRARLAALLLLAALGPPWTSHAGGPLAVHTSGRPYVWPDGGRAIPFQPDQGWLGTLDPAAAVAQTEAAFARWEAVETSSASYRNAGSLPYDVTHLNFLPFLFPTAPDGLNAIVYDEFGVIFDLLFGPDSGVLGFAGPEWIDPDTGTIVEGVGFMNGRYLIEGFPEEEMLAVQVHEFGHYSNLGHSVVNLQIAALGDTTGPSPHDTFPRQSLAEKIETMSPVILVHGGQATPHADDRAILSAIYPEPTFAATTGSIEGTIIAPNGRTKLTGVNVIARNLAAPFDDAVSAISGDFAISRSVDDPYAGRYALRGLTPGATYAVYVDEIQFGGYSTDPISPLPGPEEFYSGASESRDGTDDPATYAELRPAAGAPMRGIDVVFNRLPPGPIPLVDDDWFELFLPFSYEFCGRSFESMFVNANGTLSFDRPVGQRVETPTGFLAGPPHIAALWDDLIPIRGGGVSFEETTNEVTVHWNAVPEYPRTGANSFAITLHRATGQFDLAYGDLTAGDGLAGYSCGDALTTRLEPRGNFTRQAVPPGTPTINGRSSPAIWDWYGGDNDLAGRTLSFTTPRELRDLDEPNDSPRGGTRVTLPFDSRERVSLLAPGDIDYFAFDAPGDHFLLIETLPGNSLDTVVGLFDLRTGQLVASDDDSGAGVLSRVLYRVTEPGRYAVAVSTYPDFEFRGTGSLAGRYVLSIETIEGLLITMRDEGSYEFGLRMFDFPFQGRLWDRVYVNSNGFVSFGRTHIDFTESVAEFLQGAPRIAALWDDLNPALRGRVTIFEQPDSLTVTWKDVPEYPDVGSNTFAIRMFANGEYSIDYGATNSNDGIAGITEGGGVHDPGETDLSRAGPQRLHGGGTMYEQFGGREMDLSDVLLLFGK